ncbi:zinc finger protein [Histomonas meleagridis]|uniref:zinc finger protein DZIP1L isoform X1 n=1 Tax=Histomonas meleagridis TaxID=135588 RepID=UPI003559BEC1|nr:zinc finger protein [Histomonas meleagridis]KAH0799690.1 zinc finger protein DZIP1L isoform X1 [Histomonas meleagridis]
MLPVYYQMPYPIYHQVVSMDPSPSFRWCPRKMPMNWNLIEDVNVEQIARDMDVSSLEYLVQHIAFANLTEKDYQRFNDKSVLKAFKLLQLGVEYLTHLKRPLPVQADSADLKKELGKSRQRVDELESLLYDTELQLERTKSSLKIYKKRYESIQRKLDSEDFDEGEVRGTENRDLDPFASVQKEINQLKKVVEQRGKAIDQRTDSWKPKHRVGKIPIAREATAQQIEELFKAPPQKKPQKIYRSRGVYPSQGSLPS